VNPPNSGSGMTSMVSGMAEYLPLEIVAAGWALCPCRISKWHFAPVFS
jgi:hypothetical protein